MLLPTVTVQPDSILYSTLKENETENLFLPFGEFAVNYVFLPTFLSTTPTAFNIPL